MKFNWKRPEGAKYMTDDEAVQAGENNMRHSHATHDLFNWIGAGKEAVWDFFIQTMDMQDGDSGKFGFDPLDCTKVSTLKVLLTNLDPFVITPVTVCKVLVLGFWFWQIL